ncbi:hypothetical protein QVD17_03208 [Tagetes erecta]|uniref:NB-ARC domain-containing protein n=1 Tax=Tagetes erecta TaxID=13708 RepID=A0AAD8P9R6_TARER|nr:hypothetical protein QVD17_03208 [Tagetes erecta]
MTGMVATGSETKFIANIVDTVNYELDLKHASTSSHLTGIETRAKHINSWLKNEHAITNVLAICGMGGSGKTTLAEYIYNSNKHNFETTCFLEEVGEHSKQPYGLLGLQKQLLTDILSGKNKMISSVAEGTAKITEVLQTKKVLIVLDDIDEHDKLEALLGTKIVHTQSKIIITTRLLDIYSWFESLSWRCHVHKITLLNDHESLEVLSCHAFGTKLPLEGFSNLAVELAQCCGGNPLALKVLGSSLYVSAGHDSRERNNIIAIWRSRLNSLTALNGDTDCKIQGVLRKSFDSLPLASCKELFLHIVIFFMGEDEDYVVKILEDDWYAKFGIMTLINRCLLSISSNKKLKMHQLLQDMGRSIVREESKDPAKHTRVWYSDEAYRMLIKAHGLESIEGLALDVRKLKKGTKVLAINTSSLEKMHELKLLQLKYVKLCGDYKNFPELRWLCWHGCHLKTIPSGLLKSNFLVAIDMTRGNLEKFEPPTVLNSLKILNLKSCYKLVSIRNLYMLPNLDTLILWWCINLTHVCKTIGGLENLSLLNLAGCQKLLNDSWKNNLVNQQERLKALFVGGWIPQPSLLLPASLKFLFLDHCNLEYHNDIRLVFNGPLSGMSVRGNNIELLPNNIDLKMLRILNLSYCINLKSILCLPSTLEELYTFQCKSLEKVTFQSGRFTLRKFDYRGCFNLLEVQGFFKLVAIEELDEVDLGHMKWIKAYQYQKVDLVGDEITDGRVWKIQMLYEYGISSTYLQGTNYEIVISSEYTSTNKFLSFHVSLHPKKHKIQGINLSCLYRSSGSKHEELWPLFSIIINVTKDIFWIYKPLVYCQPKVDEDAMWLSYWSIGNKLDAGDIIHVIFMVGKEMIVRRCGSSLVYMDEGDVEQEENLQNKTMNMKEVMEGDLSEFETIPQVYYLCHHNFRRLGTNDLIRGYFADTNIPYNELHRWRKYDQMHYLGVSFMHLEYMADIHTDTLYKGIWLGLYNSKSDMFKIKVMVSMLMGVEDVYYYIKTRKLYVLGCVDSMAVKNFVMKYDKTVEIINVNYNVKRIAKRYHMNNVMWGPNFITS